MRRKKVLEKDAKVQTPIDRNKKVNIIPMYDATVYLYLKDWFEKINDFWAVLAILMHNKDYSVN